MNIQVTLRKQSFGGHYIPNYKISVSYGESVPGRWSWISLDSEDDLMEKLSGVLLNQISPVNITSNGQTILDAGDKISRLHLQVIIENWSEVDFSNTPWDALKKQIDNELESRQKKQDIEKGGLSILVTFEFDNHAQQSGSFWISTKVAHWLGAQLLALAKGKSPTDGAMIDVRGDTEIIDPLKRM